MEAIRRSDGMTIAEQTARLDGFLERGRHALNPQLVHFLTNRSYAKALQYLSGDLNIPAGVCGGLKGRPSP